MGVLRVDVGEREVRGGGEEVFVGEEAVRVAPVDDLDGMEGFRFNVGVGFGADHWGVGGACQVE